MEEGQYRYYFFGQALSICGSWVQQVALGWLTYSLSGSASLLGATSFLTQIFPLFLAPLAGGLIDRYGVRPLMIQVQLLLVLQACVLGGLAASGHLGIWHLLVAACVSGVLSSFEVPLRHALTPRLIADSANLPNAIALNSLFFNVARFIAPPLAGWLLGSQEAWWCFFLNALSFLPTLVVLLRLPDGVAGGVSSSLLTLLREGVGYLRSQREARQILVQVALVNGLATAYLPLMPAVVRDVFAAGPEAVGMLLGSVGAGALLASIRLAMGGRGRRGLERSLRQGNLVAALSLIGFALCKEIWLAPLLLFLLGFGVINCNVSSNTLLQMRVPQLVRGRVLALYVSANLGSAALGGLLSGGLAEHLGTGPVLFGMGAVLLIVLLGKAGRESGDTP